MGAAGIRRCRGTGRHAGPLYPGVVPMRIPGRQLQHGGLAWGSQGTGLVPCMRYEAAGHGAAWCTALVRAAHCLWGSCVWACGAWAARRYFEAYAGMEEHIERRLDVGQLASVADGLSWCVSEHLFIVLW